MNKEFMIIDNIPVAINGEKNLLELIRKAGIELPTFCYYSEYDCTSFERVERTDFEPYSVERNSD